MSKKRAVVIGYGGMGKWHTDEMLKSDVIELAGIMGNHGAFLFCIIAKQKTEAHCTSVCF